MQGQTSPARIARAHVAVAGRTCLNYWGFGFGVLGVIGFRSLSRVDLLSYAPSAWGIVPQSSQV